MPGLALPPQEGAHRILHIHKNVPGVLSEINTQLSKHKINILAQYLKTNEEIGYVVLDVDKKIIQPGVAVIERSEGDDQSEVVILTVLHLIIFFPLII